MFKRIEIWLAGIFKAELATAQKDLAELHLQSAKEITALRAELSGAVNILKVHAANTALMTANSVKAHVDGAVSTVKSHVSTEVDRPIEKIAEHVATEITGQFEKILSVTKVAAQEALSDARKTLRMPCEVCTLMSWKFTVTEAGKVICGDCQLKGAK